MKYLRQWFLAFSILVIGSIPAAVAQHVRSGQGANAEQLFALANQSRMRAGVGPLQWDSALAAAALKHCQRMVAEGPIAHRYGGEPDLSARASDAGAHFSLIEENIAIGPDPEAIHQEWLNSPGHRANLLNRDVDHVGIAVMASEGVLYAVADYSAAVQMLSSTQIERRIADLIQMGGVRVRKDPRDAREACSLEQGLPTGLTGGEPLFVMRWQGSDLNHLPQPLVDRLASGRYRSASVGSCRARGDTGAFTAYRLAVLLY